MHPLPCGDPRGCAFIAESDQAGSTRQTGLTGASCRIVHVGGGLQNAYTMELSCTRPLSIFLFVCVLL